MSDLWTSFVFSVLVLAGAAYAYVAPPLEERFGPKWEHRWQVYNDCDLPGRLTAPDCTWTMSQDRVDVEIRVQRAKDDIVVWAGFTGNGRHAREPAPMLDLRINKASWDEFSRQERLALFQTILRAWVASSDRGGCKKSCPTFEQFNAQLSESLDIFSSDKGN